MAELTRARVNCPECGGPLALEHLRESTGEILCFGCLQFMTPPPDVLAAAQLMDALPREPYVGPRCNDCGTPANPSYYVACDDGYNRDLCGACAKKRAERRR